MRAHGHRYRHAAEPDSSGDLSAVVLVSFAGAGVAMVTTHDLLPAWLEPANLNQADPGSLKRLLAERGVNGRGWRLCLDYGDALFYPLEAGFFPANLSYANGSNAAAYLRLLQACEMDVLPPPELVASLARWRLPRNRLSVIPPLFFRAAWKACVAAQYSEVGLDNFIETELVPLATWLFVSQSFESVDDARLKAGWDSLMRLRREWFIDQARTLGAEEWPPVVRSMEWDAFSFASLFSANLLKEEGVAMRHCVGTYADRCRSEPLRIYSVSYRKTGARVATVSAKELSPGLWEIDQIKGPGNAAVDSRVWQAASILLDTLGRESRTAGPLRCFLDGLHAIARPTPVLIDDDCFGF